MAAWHPSPGLKQKRVILNDKLIHNESGDCLCHTIAGQEQCLTCVIILPLYMCISFSFFFKPTVSCNVKLWGKPIWSQLSHVLLLVCPTATALSTLTVITVNEGWNWRIIKLFWKWSNIQRLHLLSSRRIKVNWYEKAFKLLSWKANTKSYI